MILAFTTSTDHGSVAVGHHKTGQILGFSKWTRGPQKSEALIIKINGLLKKLKIQPEDLTLIAVDKGPGSFTGCRIAVNVARTFAYTLGIPVFSAFSLDALAFESVVISSDQKKGNERVLAIMDAHKSLAYCSFYEATEEGDDIRAISVTPSVSPSPSSPPISAQPLSYLLPLLRTDKNSPTYVCGQCPDEFAKAFRHEKIKIKEAVPKATTLARMAFATSNVQPWFEVEPSYIRSPDAVMKLQQK